MTYIPATMMAALESAREIERARRHRFARPRRAAERAGTHHTSRRGATGSALG
jgi:hypothetical protein